MLLGNLFNHTRSPLMLHSYCSRDCGDCSVRFGVRALAVETHENWMEASRYINMDELREHKKLALRQAA